ncbi:MAG: hydroxyisourate hydrolase [Rhodobacterales bacterium]|nr:hydroxyisourate hydrolase [Rhodobacterales bacterium]
MAGGLSVHAVDLTRGRPAEGLAVVLADANGSPIVAGRILATGFPDCAEVMARPLPAGQYRLLLRVAEYFVARGDPLPTVPFLEDARFDFWNRDPAFHIHLPFKFSPWGYSMFRGN